jgi:purine-binding chemotaxis protein CheW
MEKAKEKTEGRGTQMITFTVGAQEYGVDIQSVKEVIRQGEITPLPRAPSFLKGVINLRGDVIPIVDLRERFALQAGTYTESSRVIVVEVGEKSVGMVVDRVSHVIRVPEDRIEDAPAWLGGTRNEFVRGVARVDERLVVLLDMTAVLSSDEMQQIARVETAEPAFDKGL